MFAVIMAGGSGTRFWPASRERLPKQFLKIIGEKTIFGETFERVRRFAADEDVYAVVGKPHAALTHAEFGTSGARIIVEPAARNTAACIGLAAAHIAKREADDPMVVLPADHFVADAEQFADTIRAAAEVARRGAIVTIGITPTRPETGYGYIHVNELEGEELGRQYFGVHRFVEKPIDKIARQYLASGEHLWNSGIFIFKPEVILQELEVCLPELGSDLREIEAAIGTADYDAVIERVYPHLPSISIDFAVMERTERPINVFKGDFGWSDVGSWDALYELRRADCDEQGNLPLGNVLQRDATGNLVFSNTERVIALLGVEGLAVIDTPDALLVARLDRAQDVKAFPTKIKASGGDEY